MSNNEKSSVLSPFNITINNLGFINSKKVKFFNMFIFKLNRIKKRSISHSYCV